MQYTILVFSHPYICFGTPCAILRGVVESSQSSMHPTLDDTPEDDTRSAETYVGTSKH
jgi:hypothetical protein